MTNAQGISLCFLSIIRYSALLMSKPLEFLGETAERVVFCLKTLSVRKSQQSVAGS